MRMLGVDLGDRRVGLAVCDEEEMIASPLRSDTIKGGLTALDIVVNAASEIGAVKVILGLPRDMSGREGAKAKEARAFAESLTEKGLDIVLWDERLTTAEAERSMRGANMSRKQRMQAIDAVAAQRILESYMQSRRFQ